MAVLCAFNSLIKTEGVVASSTILRTDRPECQGDHLDHRDCFKGPRTQRLLKSWGGGTMVAIRTSRAGHVGPGKEGACAARALLLSLSLLCALLLVSGASGTVIPTHDACVTNRAGTKFSLKTKHPVNKPLSKHDAWRPDNRSQAFSGDCVHLVDSNCRIVQTIPGPLLEHSRCARPAAMAAAGGCKGQAARLLRLAPSRDQCCVCFCVCPAGPRCSPASWAPFH